MKVELEAVENIQTLLETMPQQVICPNCGGCLSINDYPRDVVVKEKINLLEELSEKLHLIISDLNEKLRE